MTALTGMNEGAGSEEASSISLHAGLLVEQAGCGECGDSKEQFDDSPHLFP